MRQLRLFNEVAWLAERSAYPGLEALADLKATRETPDGRITTTRRLYLSSRPVAAKAALAAVRDHWAIENKLHWVLDAVLDEDRARAAPTTLLSTLPSCAASLNVARSEPSNGSIRGKIKRAAWDDAFLAKLILQMQFPC